LEEKTTLEKKQSSSRNLPLKRGQGYQGGGKELIRSNLLGDLLKKGLEKKGCQFGKIKQEGETSGHFKVLAEGKQARKRVRGRKLRDLREASHDDARETRGNKNTTGVPRQSNYQRPHRWN